MEKQSVLTERMPKPEISGTQRMPFAPDKKPVPERDYTGGSLAKGETITGYAIESKFCSNTGESEIYIVIKDGKQFILKYYYPNFQPKYEILEKLKNLHHDDIVDVLEYGTHKDRFYEIMEYALGGTLADRTEQGAYKYLPMSEERGEQVVREVVNAFKYCHEKGIIHRDIKPSNLFFKNADGTDVIIGDFGISSALDVEGKMSKRMTTTSRTEGYAAPEIYSGVLGPEVDYYALGITVFELLTGKNPFDGRNNMHIMRDTIEGRVIEDLISRPEAKDFSLKIKKLLQGLLTVRHEKRWGYVEVLRWLKGEDVPVFQNIISSIPALQYGTKNITSLQELASAIVQDKETGKKMLYRGMLERWAETFDKHIALKIGDVKESCSDESYQVFGVHQLVFLLDPARPCSNEYKITSVNDLKEYLKRDAASIGKLLRFERSVLHAWLIQHGLQELSTLCLETGKTTKSDKRLANIILLSLQGDSFRPFEGSNVELTECEQIITLPQEYYDRVLKEFDDYDSMLSIWIQNQRPHAKLELWEAWKTGKFEKDWTNFCDVLQGNIEKKNGTWKTVKQIEKETKALKEQQEMERVEREKKEQEDKAEREAREREEERIRQEQDRRKTEEERLLNENKKAYKADVVDPLKKNFIYQSLVAGLLIVMSLGAAFHGVYALTNASGSFHFKLNYLSVIHLFVPAVVFVLSIVFMLIFAGRLSKAKVCLDRNVIPDGYKKAGHLRTIFCLALPMVYGAVLLSGLFTPCGILSRDATHYYLSGKAHYESGHYSRALYSLKKAVNYKKSYAEAMCTLSLVLDSYGKTDEAIQLCKEAAASNPQLAEPYYSLGIIFLNNSKYKQAIEASMQAISVSANDPVAHAVLGMAYAANMQIQEAEASAEKAYSLGRDNLQALCYIGYIYRNIFKLDNAIAIYKKVLEHDPNHVEATVGLANAYLSAYRKKEAADILELLLNRNPECTDAQCVMSNVYVSLNNYQSALQICIKAVTAEPSLPIVRIYLSSVHYGMKDYDNALANLKEALRIKPAYSSAYVSLGGVYYATERYEESVESYRKAVELEPYCGLAYLMAGLGLLNLKQTLPAAQYISQSITINSELHHRRPNDYDALMNLGYALSLMGVFKDAHAALSEAIRIMPKNPDVYNVSARIYLQEGKYREAIYRSEEALGIDSKNTGAYSNLVAAYLGLKDRPSAMSALSKLREIDKKEAERCERLFAQ